MRTSSPRCTLQLFRDHCRHYSHRPGPRGGPECDLGVNIRAHVGGPDRGWAARMPCAGRAFVRPEDPLTHTVECELHETPTAEDVERDEAQMKSDMDAILSGRCPEHGALVERGNVRACPVPGCGTGVRVCREEDMHEH